MRLEYIAGFLDGEGCIDTNGYKERHHLRIRVTQKSKHVLKEISAYLDINLNIRSKVKETSDGYFVLILRHRESVHLLNVIQDNLIVKRAQAVVALELAADRNNDHLAQQLKELKR